MFECRADVKLPTEASDTAERVTQPPSAAGGLQRRLSQPHSALILPRQRERLSPGRERGRVGPALFELLEPFARFRQPLARG
jgi:hypothetical protein